MQVKASAFKAYDIRGIVDEALDDAFAEHLGRAFGSEAVRLGEKAVAVGRDGRVSGPRLVAALIKGLASTGLDVVDIGAVTTPMLYYVAATRGKHGCHSGIQVTGSHNPKNYNGFKMVLAGRAIYGDDIQKLRERMQNEDYVIGEGRVATMDILAEYTHRITSDCKLARPMKIVVDSGNGIPGASAPGILRALGCDVIDLYSRVDGDFPNHHPDPSKPENLVDLIRTVHATEAELGLAFDGDGDRLGVVTRGGNIIYPDRQLMLFARDILTRVKGAPIIYDVKCSQRLPIAIRDAGGEPLMWKTGHSLVKAKLKETGAPIAGEMSGHIFFSERWYGFDDATYTAGAPARDPVAQRRPERGARRAADQLQHARAQRVVRRGRAAEDHRAAAGGGEVPRRRDPDDRRPARRVPGRLRPDPRVQHHAGAGDALRGPHGRGVAAHPARLHGSAAQGQARRPRRRRRALTSPWPRSRR